MIYLFIILFLLFSIITGILNASEDKFNFHWHKSIFVKIDEYWKIRFSNKFYFKHFFSENSWKNKYIKRNEKNGFRRIATFKIHPAFTDWFHFSKSLRLILEWLQLILIFFITHYYIFNLPIILFITTYTVCSHIMRNITFSFFFNKILNGNK